jgi:hypothetical protein
MTLYGNSEEDNNIKLVERNSMGILSKKYDNDQREGESDKYDDDERKGESLVIRWLKKLDCNSEEDKKNKLVAQKSMRTLSYQYDDDEREDASPIIR